MARRLLKSDDGVGENNIIHGYEIKELAEEQANVVEAVTPLNEENTSQLLESICTLGNMNMFKDMGSGGTLALTNALGSINISYMDGTSVLFFSNPENLDIDKIKIASGNILDLSEPTKLEKDRLYHLYIFDGVVNIHPISGSSVSQGMVVNDDEMYDYIMKSSNTNGFLRIDPNESNNIDLVLNKIKTPLGNFSMFSEQENILALGDGVDGVYKIMLDGKTIVLGGNTHNSIDNVVLLPEQITPILGDPIDSSKGTFFVKENESYVSNREVTTDDTYDSDAFLPVDSISRQDLIFVEIWKEDVSIRDIIYPYGNIQFANEGSFTLEMDSSLIDGDFQDKSTYSLYGSWQEENSLVGKGFKYSQLTSSDIIKLTAMRENNLEVIGGKLYQTRFRIRIIEGLGNAWEEDTTTLQYNQSAIVAPIGSVVRGDITDLSTSSDDGAFVLDTQTGTYKYVYNNTTTYAMKIALIQRGNKGIYNPFFNKWGCVALTDNTCWSNTTETVTSVQDCFDTSKMHVVDGIIQEYKTPVTETSFGIKPMNVYDMRQYSDLFSIKEVMKDCVKNFFSNTILYPIRTVRETTAIRTSVVVNNVASFDWDENLKDGEIGIYMNANDIYTIYRKIDGVLTIIDYTNIGFKFNNGEEMVCKFTAGSRVDRVFGTSTGGDQNLPNDIKSGSTQDDTIVVINNVDNTYISTNSIGYRTKIEGFGEPPTLDVINKANIVFSLNSTDRFFDVSGYYDSDLNAIVGLETSMVGMTDISRFSLITSDGTTKLMPLLDETQISDTSIDGYWITQNTTTLQIELNYRYKDQDSVSSAFGLLENLTNVPAIRLYNDENVMGSDNTLYVSNAHSSLATITGQPILATGDELQLFKSNIENVPLDMNMDPSLNGAFEFETKNIGGDGIMTIFFVSSKDGQSYVTIKVKSFKDGLVESPISGGTSDFTEIDANGSRTFTRTLSIPINKRIKV